MANGYPTIGHNGFKSSLAVSPVSPNAYNAYTTQDILTVLKRAGKNEAHPAFRYISTHFHSARSSGIRNATGAQAFAMRSGSARFANRLLSSPRRGKKRKRRRREIIADEDCENKDGRYDPGRARSQRREKEGGIILPAHGTACPVGKGNRAVQYTAAQQRKGRLVTHEHMPGTFSPCVPRRRRRSRPSVPCAVTELA